ncbi:pitrilysin family protein [Conexibacter sp. JD483]|uniref:M16 family metallopeptidase n=1 Tax=unclassified Conexibacter TaxID=2627773 RepID=UPI00271B7E38|nr:MULTISPECIES: pitrilysin family protein [unclassified Conexibacter]MDO8188098.1 pitrilysin family protein [Conexibacter sp. CPCC 205706]MDO8196906.1 pitrilysin family protein [Conexibacter sp. CPCC 205762]MDR9370035.1 pitrilysin family protein [Conexibacter sp. JD483]
MSDHRITELESGVRIVTEAMPSVRSVSLGYWIGTGSRGEDDSQAGLSHLIEHLLFKGTARYQSLEIDQIFDGMGAELNAGTGKETTSVYSRVIDEHLDVAFDVMSEMVFRPRIDDVDSEREVILEEIAMYEDDPQDKVYDVLGEAVFGRHPLGRSIIGSADVVARTPIEAIRAFHASRYVASNVVISAAGAVDHDALVELAATRVPNGGRSADAPQAPPAPSGLTPRVVFERKDTEQYHVCLGGPGIARDDERRYALRVLDTLFGGTSSSRLFQEVRERRGLAYSVYSYTAQFSDTGQVGLYLGTRADNLAPALEVVAQELERLQRDPSSNEELERAKENLKGRIVLSLESTGARMNRLGSAVLTGMPLLSVDEVVEKIDAVDRDTIAELTAELLDPAKLSTAGIGPDEDVFRAALGPLAPEPAGV